MAAVLHDVKRKLRVQLRRVWLVWSCVPLAVVLVSLAATTAAFAAEPVLTPKRAEDSFYMLLAISALVFLLAFSLDGHWTNPKRIAAKIRRLALATSGGTPGAGTAAAETRAAVASQTILGSASALGLMGQVIGVIAVLCIVSRAGMSYAYLLLAVAVAYQLYLFSRHPYYEQLAEAAYVDDLEPETDEKGKPGNRRK
jgi:hypothetical protein